MHSNELTDYSGKTNLECHISIGKLTAKAAFLYLFANQLTNLYQSQEILLGMKCFYICQQTNTFFRFSYGCMQS